MARGFYFPLFALPFFLSLVFASVGAAQNVVATINKQAWKIDPTAGSPAEGFEKQFEMNRQAGFVEVFRILGKTPDKPDRVESYLFQEQDGFYINTTTYSLSLDKDGKFTLYRPGLEPDSEIRRHYEIKDADTMIQRGEMGTFILKRVPDFNPPRDEFTGLIPLPWQPRQ